MRAFHIPGTAWSRKFGRFSGACLAFCLAASPFPAGAATPDAKLLEACVAAKPFYVETLRELVSMDSGTDDVAELNAKKDYLVAALSRAGAEVKVSDAAGPRSGTANIVASLKGGGRAKILIICHYDTVWPKGEAAKRPFRIENDVAYGPGVADAQHSVAGVIALFSLLNRLKYEKFGLLTVVLNADEEKGSVGSKDLIMAQAAGHDLVFSMEGGGGQASDSVIISCRGNNNAVLSVKGRAAHSGENPEGGINAALELAHQMLQMRDLGNKEAYTDANWTLGSFGIKPNIIPAEAKATMNVRTALNSEADRVEALMRERMRNIMIPGCEVSLVFNRVRPPFEFNELTDTLAKTAESVFANELGRPLRRERMGGASDANFAYQKAPVLEGLGFGGGNWHALDEFLPLRGIPDRLYLLVRMIQETSEGRTVPIGRN
jgi:glutamate carboxypeptidase